MFLEKFQTLPIDNNTDYRAIKFKAWLKDPRSEFNAQAKKEKDKFADLISLGTEFAEVVSFFIGEVGISTGTIVKWRSGQSKPSRYVGLHVVKETKEAIAKAILNDTESCSGIRSYAGSNIRKL
ncbi:MAG: hypothetical protein R3D88_05430 [Alphaproteobacteria bacterium]